jgi:hypothetical protein
MNGKPRFVGLLIAGIALSALGSTGCAGARSHVVAPTAEYPISMSRGVRDADGTLLPDSRRNEVAKFSYNYRAWGWLWRIFSFTGDKDISAVVNDQTKLAKGDAITNLSVESVPCMWNVFTFVGVFPDCANVRVRGTIIQATPVAVKTPPPAAPAPAPAAAPSAPAPALPEPAPAAPASLAPESAPALRAVTAND